MVTEFETPMELLEAVGTTLGPTDWLLVDQDRVNQFADATGDDQWIHVDPVRAASGPFGGTIAHGYLTLSLTNLFFPQLLRVQKLKMGINYGLDRVRYPSVVPVGTRIRAVGEIVSAEPIRDGVQAQVRIVIEVEGGEKPACVADTISRFLSLDT